MLIELTIGLPETHFRPGLDHRPFRAVDHDRHAGDVGLGGDQLEEGDHRRLGVEQALVHVDVDDLGAVLDLLARDLDRGGIIVGHDQLLEAGRAGDVGALADIDESAAERRSGRCCRRRGSSVRCRRAGCGARASGWRAAESPDRLGDGADMRRRGAAAAADDVDDALLGPFADLGGGVAAPSSYSPRSLGRPALG